MTVQRALIYVLAMTALSCGRTALLSYHLEGEEPTPELTPESTLQPKAWDAERCEPVETETLSLPPASKRPIDVLFMVDDSGSMRDDQEAVGQNFGAFITGFQAHQVDFQLGVVTSDMDRANRSGQLVAPFLTSATPDLPRAFADMVAVGTKGSSHEEGIAAVHAALSEPLRSGANKDFTRAEADLGVVFISDEDDHSTLAPAALATFLKELKPDEGSVVVAAIIGLQEGPFCEVFSPGEQYAQVALAFGPRGLVSRCTPDYATVLSAMSGRLVASRCIVGLTRPLDAETRVRVAVDGALTELIYREPDAVYPNGSIEVVPCPPGGGSLELVYGHCR